MKRLTLVLIALLSLQVFQARALAEGKSQNATPLRTKFKKDELSARLESLIPRLMADGDVPGLSIAVVRDSELFWHRAFGVKNAETKEPVIDNTIFEAASLTKPVFAYAVLKLVERGKLDLDTPLSKYLPQPYIENDERLSLITTRRVLSHTTGFPNWRPAGQPLKIHFTPGDRFSYSGEGFVYLQKVVEHLTNQPLDQYMKAAVFEPLGMADSSLVWIDRYEVMKATSHNTGGAPTARRKPPKANAAASLQTTAQDYARFVIAINKGAGLKGATVREMLRPQIWVNEGCRNCLNPRSAQLSTTVAWGLGWGLQQTEDGTSFWHWGDNNGDVHCYVVGFPAQKLGVVIFTNSGNGHSIIPEIISEAIGGKQPSIAWINYESYKSPARLFFKDILVRGMVAIAEFKLQRRSLPQAQVNRLGYWLLGRKRIDEAIEVLKINVEDYPDSSNAYDSLGEAYEMKGDKEQAIKNYKKSVELDPNNTNGIQKLKRLQEL
ncbi:MAG TPA: serine hydrolase [Blastocatellia bacterium]|nr:serine hydrolase [Blastocatellia bacterium]